MATLTSRASSAAARQLASASSASSSSQAATSSPTLQALHRRSKLAIQQQERRRDREAAHQARREATQARRNLVAQNRSRLALERAERVARREDWELGPMAPHRELAPLTRPHGVLPQELARGGERPAHERREWGIEVGDRVVVIARGHRDRGKIGRVARVAHESQEVEVERINMANVAMPQWQLASDQDKTPFRSLAVPLPLADVRLVVPLLDPDAGVLQDTVIEALRLEPERIKRGVRLPARRFVAGVVPELEIPYPPEPSPDDAPEHDIDTLRIEVEERSWTPTLSEPPMPPTVLDELRNRYSRFRTHHDDTWVAARDAEHARRASRAAAMAARMISPLEELQLHKQAQKLADGPPELDDETLARIGAVMARNMNITDAEEPPTKDPAA